MLVEVICASMIFKSHTADIGSMSDLLKPLMIISSHQRSNPIKFSNSHTFNNSRLLLCSNNSPRCSPKTFIVDNLISNHLLLISNKQQSKSLPYFIKPKKSELKERKKLTKKCKNRWATKWKSLDSSTISTCTRVWV